MPTRPQHDRPAPPSSRRGSNIAALTALVLSLPLTGGFIGTAYADAEAGPGVALNKISICHATGSATNPFVFITPSKEGVLNGHVGHQDADDIIPSFDYRDHGTNATFPGQNATPGNLLLLNAGQCPPPAAPPVVVVPPPVVVPPGDSNENEKVTICHATGSTTNPFVLITPSKSGVLNGHVGHQDADDIIPSFTYDDHGSPATFPGQNATAANLALLAAGKCPAPAAPPVVVVPPPVVVVPPPVVVVPPPVVVVPPPAVIVPPGPVVVGPPAPVVVNPPAPGTVVPPSLPGVTPPVSTETGGGGSGVVVPTPVTFPVTSLGGGSTAPALGSGTVSAAAPGPAALPFTGADTGLLAGLSLLLIFTGAGAVVLGRTRSSLGSA